MIKFLLIISVLFFSSNRLPSEPSIESDMINLVLNYVYQDTSLNRIQNTKEYNLFLHDYMVFKLDKNNQDTIFGPGYDFIWVIDSLNYKITDSNIVTLNIFKIGELYCNNYESRDSLISFNIDFVRDGNKLKFIDTLLPCFLFPNNVNSLFKKDILKYTDIRNIEILKNRIIK